MNDLISKLQISLIRCNQAYEMYNDEKKYYQAKRIYKANLKVYNFLEEYLYTNPKSKEMIINFIFHLEDWFEQFYELEINLKKDLNLNSEFMFLRLDKSPSFPNDFLEKIQ